MALIPFDGELDAPVPGLVPFTGKLDGEPEGIVDTVKKGLAGAKNYDQAIASGINEGIANTIAGAGTFIQAPAANTLSGLASAAALVDRGITSAANFVSPGSAALNDGIQDTARSASRFAAEERAKNADSNIVANAGLKMQDFGREHAKYAQEQNKQFNPELIRQQQNMAGTEGFIGALEGIKDNPMAFTQTLARSAPDMMIGAGVAKGVASGIAAAGGSAARQVAGASTAGILSEAGSSAYQGREGVYQQVAGMPIDRLAASPRFNEILAQTGDAAKSREILANELADQVPLLSAAGTAMGSVITNKLFGGDTSARMIAGVQKTTGKDVLKNMGQESTEEAFQGVPEDLAQHGAVVQADPSAKFDLGKTIAENAAAGLAMGTGGSAISFARDNFGKQAGEIPPAPPPLPDTGPMSRSANLAISTGAAADAASVLGVPADAEQAGEQIAPKSMDSIGRVQQIDQQMQSAAPEDAAAMKAERDQITAEWPQAVSGAPTSFSTESGARIDGNYALMEAHQLVTSHDEKLKPNPAYPREMQPRERDRAASEMQISSIVQRLDPARLGESGDAGTGAPIVGADGLVESGNARTIALKRAYQGNPEKAEAYRQYLSDNAARFGIAPESVASMNTPVLVRVRNTPVDRAEFARQANASTVAQMSSSEQARSDAARIDDMGDLRPDDNGDFATSRDFIRRFVSRLPSTEQGGMVDSTGQLSQAGYARVRNAVLAKAYGESPVLARMVESLDDNMRNIGKALMRSAPEIAKLRQDVSEGALFDADVTPDLLSAVEEMSRIKDSGQSVAEYLSQGSLMGNATSPEAREMLKFLAVNMRRPGKIVEFIRNYTEALRAAGNPNQGSLLGEVAAPAKGEIINSALEKADGQAEAVSPTAGDSGKQGANQGANQGAENVGDKGAGRPAGEEPASPPSSNGGAQGDETRLSRAPSNPKNVYRAYPLAASDREKLLKRFPPKYARVVADHLTAEGLRSMDKVIEGPATGAVIGESVGGGIQSLIVTVNGNETTADGTPFHITWSAEPGVSTGTAGESAKKHGFARLKSPIAIDLSGGPSISSPLRETRNEGETDKMFAKRVIDKREAPKTLPENHADYFLMDGATVVSIANLVSTKSEAENQQGGDNGAKRMAASAQGEISKRAPITVMPSKTEPGKYEVVDGNGTLTSVKKYGWKSLPVNVVERLAGHKITWADKYTDATKAVAASGGLMFNGQPYIITDTNIDVTHSFPDILKSGVAPEVLSRSGAFVAKHYSKKPDAPVSASDRVRAEEMLKPKLELASQAKNGYDQMVLDIAEATKSLGVMLADLKGIGRAATKLVNDEKFNVAGIKDLLRSTIVVGSFNDAQKVIEGIEKRFNVMRIKNRSMTDLHGHNLKNEDRMNFGGYADVLVNVILPNGTVGEIQINTPLMSAAKSGDGHKLYEIWRDLDEESDFAKETWAEMAEYYNAAFRSMNATLDLALFKKQASEIGAAPRGLPSISRSDTPESSSTNTLPSGKTTKSSPENEARNLQPGGNLSGTFISATSKDIVAEGEEKEYTEPVKGQKGAQNVDGNNGSPSAQGQEPGAVQGTVGQRGAASVRDGTGGRNQLVNRNADNGTVEQGQNGGKEPDGGSGATQGVRGDGEGNRAGRPAGVPAGRGAGEWVAFPPETGTLGIPRAEMPQVKNDIRPELFSFLKERGIHHETESVSAASLRPTQAEFSTAKAMNWVEVREGIDRFVLTSSDGFVLDGHHQWIAALAVGENVKAIQFNAPIDKLLAAVYAFPGTKRGEGAPGGQAQARQDFQAALADLGAIFRQINPGVRMLTPEEKVKLMPTLVKLFESGIKQVGYSMKDLIAHVKAAMKASADEFVKKHWNKIDEKTYREAAAVAIDNMQNAPPEAGQTADMFAIPKPGPAPVQGDMFAAMEKVAPEVFKQIKLIESGNASGEQTSAESTREIAATTQGDKNGQGQKAEVLTTSPAPKQSAPAGRDIPPKTGRNYAFGDDDLTYAGSWIQKATQNVEAVELLVKLDQEKRQATREEQAVLAKFIGWGASDLANSLFGDKLNKPLQEISEYEVALAAFDKIGRDYLRKGGNYRGDYGDSGYYSAVGVLRNAGKILGYGPTPERITKAEVIAAKPDMTAKKWNELRDRLKAVMSEEEWADAARSTQYAHYTSKPIVKSMMSALQRMGFKGGTILEPGAGIGVFPGLMPVDMANNSAYTGIEFDAITGRILKQLFPDERILVESFIDTALPQNYYDVAFGNPPFGNIPILADPKYRKYAFSLHDYFFAKTIDSVKPGGLVPFVTSRYTMDKLNDKARAYLAERADLVGAIRLPQTAFKKNAGTDVVTDVLFLRKKVPGETFEGGQSWAKSVPITINGRQFNINEFFHAHPEMVLGKNSDAGKMANSPDPQYTVEAIEGDIDTLFDKAAGTLPENIYRAVHDTAAEDAKVRDLDFNPKAKKEGNYYVTDAGVLMVREGGIGKRAEIKSSGREAIVKDFVPLRDALKQAHFDQLNNGEWEKSLAELQKAYRAFVKKNGQIHKHTTYMQNVKVDELDDEGNPTGRKVADQEQRYRMPTLNAIKEDPDWTLVASLESFNEETGEINESVFLTDRVLKRRAPAKVETPTDAMLQVLNDIGKIDIAETARRIGLSEQETINSLGALVYNDPSAGWVTADDYLSGDIRKKLKEARAAADTDKLYQRNVEALISALPNGKTAAEITPQIGMSWIPTSIYEQFLREKANVRATVTFNERLGQWDVEAISGHQGLEATQDWGTPRRNAADILGYALSGAPVRIMQSVGFGSNRKEDFDPVATQAVTEKLNNMREAFKTWLWEDPARVETLVPIYNEKFNSIVPRSFNGDHLTLPGVSERWMKLGVFPHVKRGAWRIIQQGNTYLAHAVGSGKAQPLDAKVLTPNGWKRMGDIIPGDMVVAVDGSPTMVEAVFPQGGKEIFRVEFSDGSATECCDEHLWLTQTYKERTASQRATRLGRNWPHGAAKVRSLSEIRKTLVSPHLGAKNHSVPVVGAVQFSARPLPLDAYVLGVLLGDGGLSGNSAVLSSADQEIIDMVAAKLPDDCELVHRGQYDYTIAYRGAVSYASGGGMIPSNPVINALRSLDVFGLRSHEKHIPDLYLFNSTETRVALLQGLLDTDGWVEGGGRSLRFTTTSTKLADGVVSVVQSLGGVAARRSRLPSYTYNGVRKIGREAHELTIALPPTIKPFRLPRKAEKFIPRTKYAPVRYITNVVPVGSKPAQCILVSHKDHLYVTDDFIVTHNTNQMIISAMEQKRLGLIQKPMMVVPNHMLKQFASEWMDLYPAARLMVADEANFTGDNRRRFVARAALSDLDGVIITHSAFKLLDLDPVFKQKMIEEQLQYLRAALKEAGGTEEKTANGKSKNRDPKVKQIEKKIERWEQKLAATMSSEGKDKNVRFDEMGVDMLYVDEAHNFRKLEFTTQRQVKGIDSGGSDMASDLHMKVQWLRENKNPKRNLVMASGTPVTNTLAEIYSVQRLMAPDVLAARGLEEFDQWASMFGAESTNIEPDASGRYGPVTRFNKFVNVGELTQMFREFADVLTSDYLAATLGDKRPKVKGGSRNMIITPKTQAYTDFQRDVLQPRMKASREWKWSKDEPNNPDPIIAIIGDGRLAAIDLRFMDPKAPNDPDSKLNKMIDEVIRVYKETADREFTTDGKPGSKVEPDKGAVQMVFAELGFGAGVAANRGFNARAWFEKRLRDAGVKPEHVAFMSDNKKSSAKVKLFRDMNAGRVRIAVGTSKNMGTGVNAQQRLVALHHLDSPWFPADLEQREGRIVRQGNKHKEVELYAYAMKGSYDEQMWSTLARKQFFIDQALSGDANIREIEDLGESSQFEIAAAMVADDPRVLQLAGLRAEVERLGRLRSAHDDQRGRMQREYAAAESRLGWIERQLSGLRADAAKVQDITGDKFTAKADGKTFNTRKEWGQALMARYKDLSDHLVDKETVIGSISGFDVIYQGRMSKATTTSITTYTDGTTKTETSKRFESAIGIRASEPTILAQDVTSDPVGVAMRAQTTLAGIARAPAALESEANDLKAKRNALEPRLTAQFPMLQMLLDKMGEAAVLEDAIVASGQEKTGLEREQELEDAWQARTGAITPLFSRRAQAETPEFKAWFGDSKVVDADGKPLVVYHATTYGDFNEFTKAEQRKGMAGFGFYFSDSNGSNVYAEHSQRFKMDRSWKGEPKRVNIMPAFLRMDNPLRADNIADVARRFNDKGAFGVGRSVAGLSDDAKTAIQLAGYDGVITNEYVRKKRDGSLEIVSPHDKGAIKHPVYVVFEPTQIKSAIGNNGQFDPENPDIGFSRGNGASMAVGDLKATVDRVSRGFKNLPKVHVFASPADLSAKGPVQKALADFIRKAGAWEDVEGAMHQGEIYLFASGLADAARAEHVLATHEVTHYGLRGAIGKGLDSALHHIWLNNAAVRKEAAAIKRRNGLASNTEAVEEVLADMPAADLVKLKGWRRVVMVARDWLRNAGATNLAGRIDSWLNSTLDDQQKADLFVADLVNAARNFARNGKPASVMAGTRLADGTLAEDVAKQEKWLTAEARARGFKSIDELAEKNYPAFEKLATKWREQNPVENALLSRASETIARRKAAIAVLGDGWKGGAGSETRDVYKKRVGGLEVSVIPQRTVDGNFYIGSYYHSGQRKGVGSMAFANTLEEAAQKANAMFGAVSPKLSRAAVVNQTNTPTAAERADAILAKPAGTWRPVDAVMRAVTQAVRIDKATGYLYDKAATLIDRYTPEQIKAGVVADYGIPEAVIDRRVEMQGRQRAQIRKAGALLEKLSTLTRAESRLAYEWMNNNDPQAAAYFEKQLSPESIAVMEEIKTMVDDLSKEAVDLGQLSPEAYKRNRFEYLHRSYAKYTAEQTNGETKGRQRAIAVLGDQYKGRGMSDAVDMAKVQNVAPEWWGRKLQAGQADKGLIGSKFVRYERRAPTGEGSGALETAQGPGNTNPQKKGKLLEVAYWPADEKAPAKYSTWDQSGTWEVRDTKGGKLIVWRDFTKAERAAMGEIDEARYAIAKTLHGMIHDVETGRYLEWIGSTYGKIKGEQINGEIVEASDRMRDTFAPGTWVQVPETKIPGTSVSKYGALAGKFVPGPIWNDVRQSVGFRFGPELWRDILGAWKTAKTALSPAVHTNNVMANFVMADWHDVSAGHIAKALRIILGASKREGKGIIGRTGNLAARAGSADAEAAREIIARFHESGANMGSWVNAELQREQIEPLLDALEAEIGLAGQHTADAQVGAFAALQKALQLRFPSAWDAFKPTAAGKALTTEVGNMLDLYEGEDQVFRLAAWLKAKEDGESDLVAGRRARRSFLDYHINAPWIQAMRNSAFPFISFTYRAVPMLLETAARKPHKLMKLAMFAGLVNAIGYLLSGGDEDDERRLLPEEKAGRVWGLVPKLVRMPWNDKFGSPVFLDIRRFVPVSDIFDTGQNHAAIPMLPFAVPGGPLAIISEVVSNKSQFTGRPITLETDTGAEKAAKLADHLYKAFAPNIVILPGTHAFTGVVNAGSGRTDSFGREQSVVQAGLTSFGVKVGSYPKDVLMLNAMRQAEGQMMEIDRQITQEKRELQRRGVSEDEFMKNVDSLIVKKQGISERLQKRLGGG